MCDVLCALKVELWDLESSSLMVWLSQHVNVVKIV